MTRTGGRLLQASAAVGAVGAGIALAAGPAGADVGALMLTPTTHLHDGQSVSVFWDTGLPWPNTNEVLANAYECSPGFPLCAGSTQTALQEVQASDGDLAFQGTMRVSTSLT